MELPQICKQLRSLASENIQQDGMHDSTHLAITRKMPDPSKISRTIARPWNGLVMTPRTTM